MIPYPGNRSQVKIRIEFVHQLKAFTNCLHHTVFNAVVHHLYKMPTTDRAAIQVPVFNRDGFEQRLAISKHLGRSANHGAHTMQSTINSTAGSASKQVNANFFQFPSASLCVLVV